MKTVNFLEALEANKTKRCRLNHSIYIWYAPGEMALEKWEADAITAQWIIEETPMEIWVNINIDSPDDMYAFNHKGEAEMYVKANTRFKIVKFREVTDE